MIFMMLLFTFGMNLTNADSIYQNFTTHFSEYCSASKFTSGALLESGNFDPYFLIKDREELIRKSLVLKLQKSRFRLQQFLATETCLRGSKDHRCKSFMKSFSDNLLILSELNKREHYLKQKLISTCSIENAGMRVHTGNTLDSECGKDIQDEIKRLSFLKRKMKLEFSYLDDEELETSLLETLNPRDPEIQKLVTKKMRELKKLVTMELMRVEEKLRDSKTIYRLAKNYKDIEFGSEDFYDLEELSLYYFDEVSNPNFNTRLQYAKCQMTNTLFHIENAKNMKHFARDVGLVIASAGLGGILTKFGVGHRTIIAVDLAIEAALILSIDVPEIKKYGKRCEDLQEKIHLAHEREMKFDLTLKHQSCLVSLYSALFMSLANPGRVGIELRSPHGH
jgi:UDP-N-acetylglucosamine transferase subunit ALG13